MKSECRTDRPIAKVGRKPKLAAGNQIPLRRTKIARTVNQLRVAPSPSEPDASDVLSDQSEASPSDFSSPPGDAVVRSNTRQQLNINQKVALFPDLDSLEMHLLEMMLYKQYEIDKYLVGPSFREGHMQTFADHLSAGMPLLKDAFIACAPFLVDNQELLLLAKRQHIGPKRAAAAVASLRHLEVHRGNDLSMILLFGMILVTFALHHSGGEALICSHILGLVKPTYDEDYTLMQRLGSDGLSFFICLLGTETYGCLFRSQVPTIRLRLADVDNLVDRFIGISGPILVYLYGVCESAYAIRVSGRRRGNVLPNASSQQALDKLEQSLDEWLPTVPNNFLTGRLTPAEIVLILAQAKVLRLTALLIIHRLRFPFGSQDDKAQVMSDVILNELDLSFQLTRQSFPFGDMALLVASFEITDVKKRKATLARSHFIVNFSPHVRDEVESWLVSFWMARDNKNYPPIYWENVGSCLGE